MLGDEESKNKVYGMICDALIMNYKADKFGIDDIEIGNDDVPTG